MRTTQHPKRGPSGAPDAAASPRRDARTPRSRRPRRPRARLRPSRRLAAGRPAAGRRRRRLADRAAARRLVRRRAERDRRPRGDHRHRRAAAARERRPTTSGARPRPQGRIERFREDTRDARMQIADEAEARYGRKIAWGASIGDTRVLFTHLAVPVMTRLRQDERRVLDTLVDAGVARSRSDALAWCVTPRRRAHRRVAGRPAQRDVRGRQAARRGPRASRPPADWLETSRPSVARAAASSDVGDRAGRRPCRGTRRRRAARRRADGRRAAARPARPGSPDTTTAPGGRRRQAASVSGRRRLADDRDLHRPGDQRLGRGERPAEEPRLRARRAR